MASAACDLDKLHLQVNLHRDVDGLVSRKADSKLARLRVPKHESAVWVFVHFEASMVLVFAFRIVIGPNRFLTNGLILGQESVARGVVSAHYICVPILRGGLRTVESVCML